MKKKFFIKQLPGFTLIEVLVAVTVLAIGLLGLAGMQLKSLSYNQGAYNRSQAVQLAYDLSDRMRANRAGLTTYSTMQPSVAVVQPACLSSTSSCTATQMAQHDLYEWQQAVTSILPSGTTDLAFNNNVFTVIITWVDKKDAQSGQGTTLSFRTSFQL